MVNIYIYTIYIDHPAFEVVSKVVVSEVLNEVLNCEGAALAILSIRCCSYQALA